MGKTLLGDSRPCKEEMGHEAVRTRGSVFWDATYIFPVGIVCSLSWGRVVFGGI